MKECKIRHERAQMIEGKATLTLISFCVSNWPPSCFEVSSIGMIAPELLSKQFLLSDEASEKTWPSVRRVYFGSVELELSVFSFPLLKFKKNIKTT